MHKLQIQKHQLLSAGHVHLIAPCVAKGTLINTYMQQQQISIRWTAQKHQRAACGNSNLSTENTFFFLVSFQRSERKEEIQLKLLFFLLLKCDKLLRPLWRKRISSRGKSHPSLHSKEKWWLFYMWCGRGASIGALCAECSHTALRWYSGGATS